MFTFNKRRRGVRERVIIKFKVLARNNHNRNGSRGTDMNDISKS
jgi:hypothetical protein